MGGVMSCCEPEKETSSSKPVKVRLQCCGVSVFDDF